MNEAFGDILRILYELGLYLRDKELQTAVQLESSDAAWERIYDDYTKGMYFVYAKTNNGMVYQLLPTRSHATLFPGIVKVALKYLEDHGVTYHLEARQMH